MRSRGSWWPILALLLVALLSVHDISNPDVFWHLAVGKRILAERALPRFEEFSHTRQGAPWRTFEWLTEVSWALIERRWGALGLILEKTLWLVGAAAFASDGLGRKGWGGPARALAIAALAAGWNLANEVRPDNATVFFFAAELWLLERGLDGSLGAGAWWVFLAGGAVWANLHPGCAYGLLIAALYAGFAWARQPRRAPALSAWLAAGAAGFCLNPLGPGLLHVLAQHAAQARLLRRFILEWRPPELAWYALPFWALLAGAAAVLAADFRATGRLDELGAGLAAVTAAWALTSRRAVPYFALASLTALGRAVPRAFPRFNAVLGGKAGGVAAAALLCYFLGGGTRLTATGWDLSGFPVGAATFLEQRAPELSALKLYNPLAWGGYLEARLWPAYRVYMDGRSAFSDMLENDELLLSTSPARWQEILDRHGIGLALMRRDFPDIGGKPYDLTFMPRDRWELIRQDENSLLFRRRK